MAELEPRTKKEPVAKNTRAYALRDGSIDGKRIRAGQEFTLPAGKRPGRWMKLLAQGEAAPEKKREAKPTPVAMSQITRARAAQVAPIDTALA